MFEILFPLLLTAVLFGAYKLGEHVGGHRWYKEGKRQNVSNLVHQTERELRTVGYWEDRARMSEQKVDLVKRQALRFIPQERVNEFSQIVENIKKHNPRVETRSKTWRM